MNKLKCWAAVLIAALLLPNVAASADAAKDAYEKGKARLDKKDYDGAITAFTEAIRLDPKFALAYCNRGDAYGDKLDFNRAITDFNKAIRLDPKLAMAYCGRGIAYRDNGIWQSDCRPN